jgi:hypothetical protein
LSAGVNRLLMNSDTIPANIARRPAWTTSRGDTFGRKRGMPPAEVRSVIDSGMILTAVSIAESPSATER